MELSEILNIILGGGLIGTIVTLRSTARKAKAEAVKAEADAETVRIDNAEHATRILVDNIVKPLKDEFNETKEELVETKKELARNTREMARLRKALDGANSCEHRDGCPVLDRLREQPKDRGCERGGTDRGKGQHREQGASCGDGACTDVGSEPDPEDGQPP
ncbi:hypothetical protein AB9N12_01450 [Bacteroides sp. AN502(2024)]|uniref:hypothetical protein n=1 Tax=Bacteroides sp. AN502(2024) TaxID=3160599 RepID=UPI003516FB21